jgi:hypothetical protein
MKDEELVILGGLGLLGLSMLGAPKASPPPLHKPTITIPFVPFRGTFYAPDMPGRMAITGLPVTIFNHDRNRPVPFVMLLDTGHQFPVLDSTTADLVGLKYYPPAEPTQDEPPGGRIVPISLPGIGKTIVTLRTAIGNLIPPRIFMDKYNVSVSSTAATFTPKHEINGIPYLHDPSVPEAGTPVLAAAIDGMPLQGLFDTGAFVNTITKETADRVDIYRYPKVRAIYDDRAGYSTGYLAPLTIVGLGTLVSCIWFWCLVIIQLFVSA